MLNCCYRLNHRPAGCDYVVNDDHTSIIWEYTLNLIHCPVRLRLVSDKESLHVSIMEVTAYCKAGDHRNRPNRKTANGIKFDIFCMLKQNFSDKKSALGVYGDLLPVDVVVALFAR